MVGDRPAVWASARNPPARGVTREVVQLIRGEDFFQADHQIIFDCILDLYGRMVAAGEWRDYAIDFLKDRAVFSVFRRSSEQALYRIDLSTGRPIRVSTMRWLALPSP